MSDAPPELPYTLPDNYFTVLNPISREQTEPDVLANLFQCILFGIIVNQVITYLTTKTTRIDGAHTKLVIFGATAMQTILTIFVFFESWKLYVTSWGDFTQFFGSETGPYWADTYGPIFPILCSLLLQQSYWLRMLWQIGVKNKFYRGSVCFAGLLMLYNFASCIVYFNSYMVLEFHMYQIGAYGYSAATASVDLLISFNMLHFFITNRHKASARTGNIMTAFIRYFILTGASFSAFAIASCALPNSGWSQFPDQLLPFVMQVCLMSTINGRDELLDNATQRTYTNRATLPLSRGSAGERTYVGNSSSALDSKLGKNGKTDDDPLVSQV